MATVQYQFTSGTNDGGFDEASGFETTKIWDSDDGTAGSDNNNGHYFTVTGNDCPGTDLGTITGVSIAILWANNSTIANITFKVQPLFGGSSAGDEHTETVDVGTVGSQEWSSEHDITNDTNAPSTWTWADVQNLDLIATTVRASTGKWYPFAIRITVTYSTVTTQTKTVTALARIKSTAITKTVTAKAKVKEGYTVDSYDGSGDSAVLGQTYTKIGQSFTGNGLKLINVILNLSKLVLTPSGTAYVKIYAHSGTYGTSSVPTGAALATSDSFDVSVIISSQPRTFTFSGSNQIILENGTHYVLSIEHTSTDTTTQILVQMDSTSPTHDGNLSAYDTSWGYGPGYDLNFEVNGIISPEVTKTVTAKARIKSTGTTKTVAAKASIVKTIVLVSPADASTGALVPLVWEIPTLSGENAHAEIQIDDTSSAFGSIEQTTKSYQPSSGMEYYDGADWQPYPEAGVTSDYYGNQARYTPTGITEGTKYWRVRTVTK